MRSRAIEEEKCLRHGWAREERKYQRLGPATKERNWQRLGWSKRKGKGSHSSGQEKPVAQRQEMVIGSLALL